jgi:AraC-like DNA-binding protein
MNTAYDLTAAITHAGGLSFIAGYLLISDWVKWSALIMIYPVSIWILGVANSNASIIVVVANRIAMSVACVYTVIGLSALLKNRRKIIAGIPQVKTGNGFYTITEPEKRIDKVGRFLNEEKLTHFNSLINQFLIEKKPFLQQKYSLRELANDVHIPVNYLSAFINRYHKMNYSDFINRYRVSQSKEMIVNGEWKHKTLEAIASDAGFNNRNTFTAAFRKETGQSPSEFLKGIKKEQRGNRALSNTKKNTFRLERI